MWGMELASSSPGIFSLPALPPWEQLHPLVVHFPIALLLVAPIFVVLALLWKKYTRGLLVAATLLVVLGAAGAVLAVETGEAGEEIAERTAYAARLLHEHEELAETARTFAIILASVLSSGTIAYLFATRKPETRVSRPLLLVLGIAYLLLHSAGCLVLANTAHAGGKLVREGGLYPGSAAGSKHPAALQFPPPTFTLPLPSATSQSPSEAPGLHNLVAFTPVLISGALPAEFLTMLRDSERVATELEEALIARGGTLRLKTRANSPRSSCCSRRPARRVTPITEVETWACSRIHS
jgi:uncharacterized membrane protein